MNYADLRQRSRARFNEVQVFLSHISALEPNSPMNPPSLELKIQRGLFYVQLYGALEKSINDAIETTLLAISSKSVRGIHYSIGFNPVALFSKLQSLRDSGNGAFFTKAAVIFEHSRSSNVIPISETIFADKLQNVWVKSIEEVYRALGMGSFTVTPRERATIDELVDKRNAVAHGREKASTTGERHRSNVLRDKFEIISGVSSRIIGEFENFYEKQGYLKPSAKRYYV